MVKRCPILIPLTSDDGELLLSVIWSFVLWLQITINYCWAMSYFDSPDPAAPWASPRWHECSPNKQRLLNHKHFFLLSASSRQLCIHLRHSMSNRLVLWVSMCKATWVDRNIAHSQRPSQMQGKRSCSFSLRIQANFVDRSSSVFVMRVPLLLQLAAPAGARESSQSFRWR